MAFVGMGGETYEQFIYKKKGSWALNCRRYW
jgi:hypothetical protein